MRWTRQGPSEDLEDRRGERAGIGFGGGGMGRAAPIGLGGLLIVILLSWLTGQDFLSLLDPGGSISTGPGDTATRTTGSVPSSPAEEERVQFVSFVLDDGQATWERLLQGRYERTRLVLFRDAIDSACGFAESASGPFYCPGDRKVYIDLSFYDELKQRFGAAGDFAQAYVLAHEIGHHVQNLLGTEPRVRQAQRSRPDLANDLSVRMELQADCYAGIWGHSTAQRQILEQGDVEEGLNAAAAIGDDRIQRMGGGRVAPERFTHGSSAQRVEWFRRGLESGRLEACDTFGGS
jgi:predicted metalloprotease